MKKRIQKILSVLVALTLSVSMLTACGSGSAASSSATENSAAGESTKETNQSALSKTGVGETKYAAGEFKKYDENITVTFGNVNDENGDGILKMEAAGEPLRDNRWTRYFKDELNITSEYEMLVANTVDYDQKLLLAMASGTLPDVFLVNDLSVLKQLAESGAIADMTTTYKDNVNTTLRDLMEYEGKEIYNPVTVDGKLYGIPVKMPSTNGYNHC